MDQVRKKDAIEAEWLRNYQLIRNLYLSDMSLNDLVYWLGIFENFTVTFKSQLAYRLKKWKISKKIDCDSWKYIDQTINKRKLEGKESDVLLSGKRVKQSTIEKETYRHHDKSIPARILPESHIQSITLSDQLIICTPQAYVNELEWPETLPWFKFRSKLQQWLSYTQLHRMTSEQRGLVLNLLTSKILLVGDKFDQSQASYLIPRLAMNLVMGMPEYFPGEHLHTAQIIATGTTNVMIPECLKLILYKVSNNMVSTWEADDFENLYTILSKTGLLGATDSLRRARQQDLTIRAFMDNLFRGLIIFICSNKKMAGAVISRRSNVQSIMIFAFPDRICDSGGEQIIRLFLSHYRDLTTEEILHAAILLHDERLFEQALDNGADVSLPMKTLNYIDTSGKSSVIGEETELCTAAAVDLHATSAVFDHLQNQNQVIEAASFITPDVFISAARAGNADVISFLHEINPIGFRRNACGYLLANCLDVNLTAQQADISACQILVPDGGPYRGFQVFDEDKPLTVLELFLRGISFRDDWNDAIKLLFRSGAFFPAEAILQLSSAGHDDVLSAALDAGGDPNVQYSNGDSALALALRSKSTNCVQLLLERGAKLKILTSEILCSAVLVENHWVIDFLLKNRSLQAPDNILEGTAVGLAAMLGNIPLVRKLIAQLQKPETALLPFFATFSSFLFSHNEGLQIISSHTFWDRRPNDNDDLGGYTRRRLVEGSPLALAASNRGTAGFSELLSCGYQPDDVTWARAFSTDTLDYLKELMDYNLRVRSLQLPLLTLSPLLRYAIRHEMEAEVDWLIESGADINENDVHQYLGRSPVQYAVALGHLTIAESSAIWIKPLQGAAIEGHIGLAKQLLDAGARVNARGSRLDGRTALEGAAKRGRLDMVELLLHHKALTTGPGRFQFIRAIHMAEREGHHATAELLRQSREWTDKDTHIYDSMCSRCPYYFSEPRPSGTGCHACNSGYTPGQYCCDEIHMPEDDCYHCYTEDEERHYGLGV
ncbi:hypothetical protein BKA60DRAFT_626203 [Fusarium oxysporum]|nr:hypothetical protein BKA60DRAFT_626203 [Fusarium oxysporum]